MKLISKEVFNSVNTLDDLIALDPNLPPSFKSNYEFFKEYLLKEFPQYSPYQIIEIYGAQELSMAIHKWNNHHRLMACMEFEYYKSPPFNVAKLEEE